ncbi:hypothetical protein NHQ30_000017 [Ciborinia camelliae]|nr:hypothetical protein NHQ30_000017 [Ciborinia camelliae]
MTTVKPIVEERQHHSWGLLVQGRPATPSEGRAQQYTRIGPKDSQSLITHNNGTCLEFGPWDLVDEFDASKPFHQQILLIDTTIKDIQSVRIRHNDNVGDEVDVFRGFRTIPYSGEVHQHQYPNGEVYNQVPSYYASVSNTPSMYSTMNKSDILGEAHPGLSSDTRFGVLVPNQNQNQGRNTGTHHRFDRQSRGNHHSHIERGSYSQHLNRRGRRDAQFGRGQGRDGGRGHGRGHVRDDERGNGRNDGRCGYYQHQEHDYGQQERWGYARQDSPVSYHAEDDRSYRGYNGEHFGHVSMVHGQQAPVYPSYEEANPHIPPPDYRTGMMDFAPSLQYVQNIPNNFQFGVPAFFPPPVPNEVPFYGYAKIGGNNEPVHDEPASTMESHVGGRSAYFVPDNDVGIAPAAMGLGQGRKATGPWPRVVLPPTTPGGDQTYAASSAGYEGHIRANVHPPTPFGRSPMRTTTDEGSPLMRPRRNVTDPANQFTPISHNRTNSGSGTDLRRLATGHSGFSIAEPRSSPSTGAFSPAGDSPGMRNTHSITARSSPGLSFSNLGPVGRSMPRTSSSHELSYVGYTISGQQPGSVSRATTPPENTGRRWFESRQYVPDGSRMSSPGFTTPGHNRSFYANSRSEDGQM